MRAVYESELGLNGWFDPLAEDFGWFDPMLGEDAEPVDFSDTDSGVGTSSGLSAGGGDALELEDTNELLLEDSSGAILLEGAGGAGGTILEVDAQQTDTGTGTEVAPARGLSGTDTGAGTDSWSIAATLSGTDTGAGTDSWSIAATLSDTDTGTGSDSEIVAALGTSVSETGTGTGTDTWSIAATSSGTDTGTGSDTQTVSVSVSDTDSGTGSDSHLFDKAFTEVDSALASAVEDVFILYQDLFDTDSGVGYEHPTGPAPSESTWLSLTTAPPRRPVRSRLSGRT